MRRRRVTRGARGFALSETLVALAIGALILGLLLALHVSYVGFTGRLTAGILDARAAGRLNARLNRDPCAEPAALFVEDGNGVAVATGEAARRVLSLEPDDRREGHVRLVSAELGSIDLRDSVSLRTVGAIDADGQARPGRSAVIVETPREIVATGAMRCDLPEICASARGGPCRVITNAQATPSP